jgi:hypothetical protein
MGVSSALQPACRNALAPERDLDRVSSSDCLICTGRDTLTALERELRSRRLRREINERVVELTKQFALDPASDPPMIVFCECVREDCMTQLAEMKLSEYEPVLAGPGRWVVLSAHIDEPADSILARRDGYALIHRDSRRLSTEDAAPKKESTSPPQADSSQH